MTTSGIHAREDRSAPAASVGWQLVRAALGALSAGIGVYQMSVGHGVGAAFSFFMAATFFLSVACERAIARARQNGVVVPMSVMILLGTAGAAIGGAVVLGVLVANRGL
jgi:hypothetical protein